jgi:hypothetical protein
MWIGKNVKGSFHLKFDIIYELQKIGKDAVKTQYEQLCGLEQMWKNALMIQFDVLWGLELCEVEELTTFLK